MLRPFSSYRKIVNPTLRNPTLYSMSNAFAEESQLMSAEESHMILKPLLEREAIPVRGLISKRLPRLLQTCEFTANLTSGVKMS